MGVRWVSILAFFFCMDVALAAADWGCSASRQNGTVSTGLMTFHGLHSLFLKVTLCFHSRKKSIQEEYFFTKTGHSEGTLSYVPGKHLREGLLTNSLCILRGQRFGFRVSGEDFCPVNIPAVTVQWDLGCHKSC